MENNNSNVRTMDPSVFAQFIPSDLQVKIDTIAIKNKFARCFRDDKKPDTEYSLQEIQTAFDSIQGIIDELRGITVSDEIYQTGINNKIKTIVGWKSNLGYCIDTMKLKELTLSDVKSSTMPAPEPVVNKEINLSNNVISATDEKTVDELYKASESISPTPVEVRHVEVPEQKPVPRVQVEEPETDNIIVALADDENDDFDTSPDAVVDDSDSDITSIVEENEQEGRADDITNVVLEDAPVSKEENIQNNYVREFKSKLDGIKTVSKASTNSMIKLMSKTEVNPATVKLFDVDLSTDTDFQRHYLESRNNMLATPRVTRVAHVLSGFFSEVSAYSEFDLISVNRNLSYEKDFVRQEMLIYNSVFSHVKYVSFKSKDVSFKDWCDALLLPDVNSLFFGVYDANYPGINEYQLTCGKCGSDINIRTDNDDLGVYINKRLDKDYVKELISLGDARASDVKMLNTPYKDEITKRVIRKRLSKTGIIIEYGMPTLQTYLETITALQEVFAASDTKINLSDINDPQSPDYDMLRIYLYIKTLGMPVKGKPTPDGTIPLRHYAIRDRKQIVSILANIGRQDFTELFTGKEVKELANVSGTSYYIRDVHCDKCKIDLQPVLLNPQENFFFKLGEEPNKLRLSI